MIACLGAVCLCGVVLVAAAAEPPGGYYTTRYDHIDIDNILNQKRLVHYYSACLLDRGPCTPQGLEFKRILPEAIKTNCLRCTEKQRVVTMRSIRRLMKQYPDVWAELAANWDPTGEYVKRLEESYDRSYPARSPTTSTTPAAVTIGERFGGIGEVSPKPSPTTIEPSPIFTIAPDATFSSTTSTTTTRITPSKSANATRPLLPPAGIKPFSSIGVNLVVPNPARILDAISNSVKLKTGMFLDTVNYVLRG